MGGSKKGGKAARTPWPSPGFQIESAQPTRDNLSTFYEELQQVEAAVKENAESNIPRETLLRLLTATRITTGKVRDYGVTDSESKTETAIDHLAHKLDTMQNHTEASLEAIKKEIRQPAASRDYRQALATSTIPATSHTEPQVLPTREDLKMRIRNTNTQITNPLRRKEVEVVQAANRTIREMGIKDRVFSAGRVLPSGDVTLQADSIGDITRLQNDQRWCQVFGEDAKVQQHTYGVVVHGMPYDQDLPSLREKLQAANKGRMGNMPMEITHMNWLMKQSVIQEKKLHVASLMIEFSSDRVANTAIQLGLAHKGRNLSCAYYDRTYRLQQCFNCCLYGHIARNCRRPTSCMYCAGGHPTTHCTHSRDKTHAKCAACLASRPNEAAPQHFAYHQECPVRRIFKEKATRSRIEGPVFHTPPMKTPKQTSSAITDLTNTPTPAEASLAPRKTRSKGPKTNRGRRTTFSAGDTTRDEPDADEDGFQYPTRVSRRSKKHKTMQPDEMDTAMAIPSSPPPNPLSRQPLQDTNINTISLPTEDGNNLQRKENTLLDLTDMTEDKKKQLQAEWDNNGGFIEIDGTLTPIPRPC